MGKVKSVGSCFGEKFLNQFRITAVVLDEQYLDRCQSGGLGHGYPRFNYKFETCKFRSATRLLVYRFLVFSLSNIVPESSI